MAWGDNKKKVEVMAGVRGGVRPAARQADADSGEDGSGDADGDDAELPHHVCVAGPNGR